MCDAVTENVRPQQQSEYKLFHVATAAEVDTVLCKLYHSNDRCKLLDACKQRQQMCRHLQTNNTIYRKRLHSSHHSIYTYNAICHGTGVV